ncbi:MAG: thioredoxin domain-containing protein [Candidatus Paceibacterota bacterium]|jgi:protein-disulfide isomerase
MEEQKNKISISSIIIVVVFLVVLIGLIATFKKSPVPQNLNENSNQLTILTPKQLPEAYKNDHYFGNGDESVVIVEYSDTECPFCKRFQGTMQEVMKNYSGRVAWVYRHVPLDSLHTKARKEAEATECAAELGGNEIFWKYLDAIFTITPSNDGLDLAELPKIAVDLGLNKVDFEECLASGKYAEKVEADAQLAVKAGAKGAPYSVIIKKDGTQTIVNGAYYYDLPDQPTLSLKTMIEAALK